MPCNQSLGWTLLSEIYRDTSLLRNAQIPGITIGPWTWSYKGTSLIKDRNPP